MRTRFSFLRTAALLVSMSALSANAGTATFDFNDPGSVGIDYVLWGAATWQPEGTGGYLQLTTGTAGSQQSAFYFNDFDNGLVVKAFTFSCDLKIGDGTADPADGFSVSYARENDPALLSQDGNNWAPSVDGTEASLPEEGTRTGISIGFDAWQSGPTAMANGLPDGDVHYDCIGLSVRVDGELKFQVPMRTKNGAPTDPTSLQTGPRDEVNPGSGSLLTWQPLKVQLAEDGSVSVWWKNVQVLTNLPTSYFPSRGRLVFTGRTGGSYQLQAVDNMSITTVAAADPTVSAVTLNPLSLIVNLQDAGAVSVNSDSVTATINGQAVALTSSTRDNDITKAIFDFTTPFASQSTNHIEISFTTSAGGSVTVSRDVVVIKYMTIPGSLATAAGVVDTTKPGFNVRAYGTEENQPNNTAWTEEQLAGLHGPNLADLSAAVNGIFEVTDVINFARAADGNVGFFTVDNGFQDMPLPGFPGTQTLDAGTGNASLEILTYLDFAHSGLYTFNVNSDDGFKMSIGPDPRDIFSYVPGEFSGGRGAGSGTTYSIYVPQAGIYPTRLIWENGGGGANVEWFTINEDGTKVLVNDVNAPTAVKAYRVASKTPPYVPVQGGVSPAINATGVRANADVVVKLVDGTTTVDPASIGITINGTAGTVTTSKSGTTTTATVASTGLFAPDSIVNVVLVYSDSGSPKYTATNSWSFRVMNYTTLSTALVTGVNSGDATKPGFIANIQQIAPTGSVVSQTYSTWAEQQLAGLFGANVAYSYGAQTEGGFDFVCDIINWNRDAGGIGAEIGSFQGPTYPDSQIPGMPGSGVREGGYGDISGEILTYIQFPTAGFYVMCVNSDDGFKVQVADTAPAYMGAVKVTGPAAVAGSYGAMSAGSDKGGFALPLPTTPITGKLVYANPPTAETDIINTNEISGNIALIDRGVNTFEDKCKKALAAGAIAVVIVNNRDAASAEGVLPIVMTGNPVAIPAVMMMLDDGAKLKAELANNVIVSLGSDSRPVIGSYEGGKGASDITFGFQVPQAGVYPFRCVWYQGGGGANCEWFMITQSGEKILINDTTNPRALKAYRARTETPVQTPTLTYQKTTGNIVLTFTGKLKAADKVEGPYNDVNVTSPATIPTTGPAKFYRGATE